MIPNQTDLDAALRKVRADFSALQGVESIRLMFYKGHKPVIVVKGSVPERPTKLPKAIRSFADAKVYPIAILWQGPIDPRASMPIPVSTPADDLALNNDLWAGAPPVRDEPLKMWEPASTILQPVGQMMPVSGPAQPRVQAVARLPQFATPNFWAKPFHEYGNLCCPFYERRTVAYSFKVPSDYLLIVNGLSYEFSDLVLFDQFIIHINRDEEELTRWYDMKATNDVDPATNFVFAGHYRPFKLWARFDHDQTFVVSVTVRGPYPFTKSPDDTLGGCVSVFPRGWLGSLYDNRDGGARPVDMGELNDIYLGEPSDA